MRKRYFLLAVTIALTLQGAFAGPLATPTGKVVLTISGKIGESNSPKGAQFDMAMIEKLPQHSFTTLTPWLKQPVKFTGPLLRDVLAAVKAQGTVIKAASTPVPRCFPQSSAAGEHLAAALAAGTWEMVGWP